MADFICVIGMVLIIEGVPYMLFPDSVKSLAHKIDDIPRSVLQIMGLLAAICGLALVYFARRGCC